jgi:hypothetical protein
MTVRPIARRANIASEVPIIAPLLSRGCDDRDGEVDHLSGLKARGLETIGSEKVRTTLGSPPVKSL